LAERHTLTAVDLSAALIEECKKGIADEGLKEQVRFVVPDARDLGEVAEKRLDAALLIGPLYHLVAKADRKAGRKETFDRLRKGGIIFSSSISCGGG
jgi:predicted O-methyltransferase YrrM